MKTPRNYQALREEQARATSDQTQKVPQQDTKAQSKADVERVAKSTRQHSPGWSDSASMDAQQGSALAYNKWANADAQAMRNAQAHPAPNVAKNEAGKAALAADLKQARGSLKQSEPVRPVPTKQQLSGNKAALAADLKEARESSKQPPEQARNTSRTR